MFFGEKLGEWTKIEYVSWTQWDVIGISLSLSSVNTMIEECQCVIFWIFGFWYWMWSGPKIAYMELKHLNNEIRSQQIDDIYIVGYIYVMFQCIQSINDSIRSDCFIFFYSLFRENKNVHFRLSFSEPPPWALFLPSPVYSALHVGCLWYSLKISIEKRFAISKSTIE